MLKNNNRYSLSEIEFCLKNKSVLQQRAEATGNMSATVDSVIDAENCLSKASLTANQFIVLQLRWLYNFTLKDCGNMLGVSVEAVRQSENSAKTKIQKVLDVWNEELLING